MKISLICMWMILLIILSYEISFSYESMINKTRFEREAIGNSEMNYSTFSLSFKFWFWRYYIKHSRQYLITFSNISRLIKNTSQSVVFSTLLVFGNVVKHGHSCYIYHSTYIELVSMPCNQVFFFPGSKLVQTTLTLLLLQMMAPLSCGIYRNLMEEAWLTSLDRHTADKVLRL